MLHIEAEKAGFWIFSSLAHMEQQKDFNPFRLSQLSNEPNSQ